jgi:hypothetical protein
MRPLIPTALLTALACLAQPPAPASITVPAGTKVSLRLTAALGTNTAKPGDAVRAEVAFPVTASNAVAIPAGTYAEGVIDQVARRGRHAGFLIHFTTLVYSNGYTVPLSAATADTRAALLRTVEPPPGTPSDPAAMPGAMALQTTTPTVTAPSMPGPSRGLMIGIGLGSAAAAVIAGIAFGHRGGTLYLKTGSPFEMTLANPLSLDAAKVAAAVAMPSPQ